jgi:hypothetical protein
MLMAISKESLHAESNDMAIALEAPGKIRDRKWVKITQWRIILVLKYYVICTESQIWGYY